MTATWVGGGYINGTAGMKRFNNINHFSYQSMGKKCSFCKKFGGKIISLMIKSKPVRCMQTVNILFRIKGEQNFFPLSSSKVFLRKDILYNITTANEGTKA